MSSQTLTVEAIESIVKQHGFEFMKVDTLPTSKQLNKRIIYYLSVNNMPSAIKEWYAEHTSTFNTEGIFMFQDREFLYRPHVVTKVRFIHWLFPSIKCGICFEESLELIDMDNACGQCGFRQCIRCLAIRGIHAYEQHPLPIPVVAMKCPSCRDVYTVQLPKQCQFVMHLIDTFNASQQLFIRKYASIALDQDKSECRTMLRLLKLYKHKMDKTKCIRCEKEFDQTRNKCGACKRVYYCGIGCQQMHWKSHKSDCKKWRIFQQPKPQ